MAGENFSAGHARYVGALHDSAKLVAQQSGGRKTALALILGIAFAEMVLSGKLGGVWSALWGPVAPLGKKVTVEKMAPVSSLTPGGTP